MAVSQVRTITFSGERFAALVQESMLGQEGFASALGMSRSGLRLKMRPGPQIIFRTNFRKVAELLRISPAELKRRIGATGDAESKKDFRDVRLPLATYDALAELAEVQGVTVADYLARHVASAGRMTVIHPRPSLAKKPRRVAHETARR